MKTVSRQSPWHELSMGGVDEADVLMPDSTASPYQSTSTSTRVKYLPKKNTPLPYKERHFPFDKRTAARDRIWPNGARMALVHYCALEQRDWNYSRSGTAAGRTLAAGKEPLDVRTSIAYGGEIALRRLRNIWKELGLTITQLVTASYAEDFPEIVKELADLGHEINNHTYSYSIATVDKTYDQQREEIRDCTQILQRLTGQKPVGWLSQGAGCDENTVAALADEGYLYHCDLQDDELPYFIDVNGKTIVEIPYRMTGNFNDNRVFGATTMKPKYALEYLKETFDNLCNDSARYPKHTIFGTHPHVTGRGDNARVYAEFLQYVKRRDDVWFATYKDVAEWWMKQFNHGYDA